MIHFKTKEGDEVYFNENGDPPAKYEIINWQPTENGMVDFVTVGLYDASLPADKQLKLQNKTLVWAQNSEQVNNESKHFFIRALSEASLLNVNSVVIFVPLGACVSLQQEMSPRNSQAPAKRQTCLLL